MANPEVMAQYIAAQGEKPRKPKRAKQPGTSLAYKSEKQAILDAKWSGLREMYIWLVRAMSLEEALFRCIECGRWCPPKGYGYSHDGYWGEADHEIRRSRGGDYTARNFSWRCSGPDDACHTLKHNAPGWTSSRRTPGLDSEEQQ